MTSGMRRIPNLASERGAVLIQTALVAVVLVGFGTFAVDYGVLWIARNQAQNAADAGAMAGALARAYEDFFDDPVDSNGVAALNASQVASANLVWGVPATAALPPFDTACPPEVGAAGHCVRVDVFRNGYSGSSPLPTWFGPALGVASQGVKATATAQVLIANATNCLRPWAVPDKWVEPVGFEDANFRRYAVGTGAEVSPHDDYSAPNPTSVGTGRRFATSNAALGDVGSPLVLNPMSFADVTTPTTPIPNGAIPEGALVALDLDGGYDASRAACNGQIVAVGSPMTISPDTPIGLHFADLVSLDPGAHWNPATNTIDDTCAPVCAPISPRLVAIALYDVDLFQLRHAMNDWSACPVPGTPCVSIVNIVGFFIADAIPHGFFTSYPGVVPTDPPKLMAQSSFLKAIALVR